MLFLHPVIDGGRQQQQLLPVGGLKAAAHGIFRKVRRMKQRNTIASTMDNHYTNYKIYCNNIGQVLQQAQGKGPGKENDIPVWVLYRQGKLSAFQIYEREGSSRKVYERPYRIVWHFEGFYQNSSRSFFVPPKEELPGFFQDLKEALTTRGYLGVVRQIPETIVSFDESFNVA